MDINKQKPPKWCATNFKDTERDHIRATLQKLIEEGHIDFAAESSIKVNMDKLVDQLKRDS